MIATTMLLSTILVFCATLLTSTAAEYAACGLLPRGSPPVPTITHCEQDSVCTPIDPLCTKNCTGSCIPMQPCSSASPCSDGFSCVSRKYTDPATPEEEQRHSCEPTPEKITINDGAVKSGGRCGMNLPDCPQPTQYCDPIDMSCFNTDVCPGICKVWPVQPPPKYPSCGGMTRKPDTCIAPNVCMDDPYKGGCGMACDAFGICVK
jgi:hypothetical protein